MEEKRRKYSISSDNSDTTDSHATSASRCSKMPSSTKSGWPRQNEKKPSEVFRTDLITAMKIPDSYQLSPDDYYILADPWRQEWEKGVQVPAGAEAIPEPVVRAAGAGRTDTRARAGGAGDAVPPEHGAGHRDAGGAGHRVRRGCRL
uniref:Jade family PHD finger 2 n=1 Tax=Ovis aries TaxID=9940 RepID=A0AC11B6E8_SHEEP